MSKFYIGQKIVCLVDYGPEAQTEWAVVFGVEFPQQNGVYTVRRIVCRPDENDEYFYGVMLDEVLNLPNPLHIKGGRQPLDAAGWQEPDEVAFWEDHFRPVLKVSDFVVEQTRQTVEA